MSALRPHPMTHSPTLQYVQLQSLSALWENSSGDKECKLMFRSAFFHSKWLLATLILIGLAYFEGRLNSRLVTDNRMPTSTQPSSTP